MLRNKNILIAAILTVLLAPSSSVAEVMRKSKGPSPAFGVDNCLKQFGSIVEPNHFMISYPWEFGTDVTTTQELPPISFHWMTHHHHDDEGQVESSYTAFLRLLNPVTYVVTGLLAVKDAARSIYLTVVSLLALEQQIEADQDENVETDSLIPDIVPEFKSPFQVATNVAKGLRKRQ